MPLLSASATSAAHQCRAQAINSTRGGWPNYTGRGEIEGERGCVHQGERGVLTPRLFYRGVNTPRSPTLPEGSHPPSANSTGGFTPPARQLYRGVHTPRPR